MNLYSGKKRIFLCNDHAIIFLIYNLYKFEAQNQFLFLIIVKNTIKSILKLQINLYTE